MKFLIQTDEGEIIHDFSFQLIQAIKHRNWWDGKETMKYITSDTEMPEGYIPIGSVEFVNKYLKKHFGQAPRPINIPEELWGETIEICFRFLSGNEAVAIKVFSMSVLYNLSLNVPEIITELKVVIEDHLPYGSAGFKSRARKVLAKLD